MLDEKEIIPSEVTGFLHRARINRGHCELEGTESCPGNEIKPWEEYIKYNHFGDFIFHTKCFGLQNEEIIGVKVRSEYRYGVTRKVVICERFRIH